MPISRGSPLAPEPRNELNGKFTARAPPPQRAVTRPSSRARGQRCQDQVDRFEISRLHQTGVESGIDSVLPVMLLSVARQRNEVSSYRVRVGT